MLKVCAAVTSTILKEKHKKERSQGHHYLRVLSKKAQRKEDPISWGIQKLHMLKTSVKIAPPGYSSTSTAVSLHVSACESRHRASYHMLCLVWLPWEHFMETQTSTSKERLPKPPEILMPPHSFIIHDKAFHFQSSAPLKTLMLLGFKMWYMAHSSTLINGSIDEDPENQAAARSFLGFVEDSESLETDFWLCGDQSGDQETMVYS